MSSEVYISFVPPNRVFQAALAAMILSGCGAIPQKVSIEDREVKELLASAGAERELRKFFAPIPPDSEFHLERRSSGNYDRMLHIASRKGRIGRTIAFRREEQGYRWIGEQVIFYGPEMYDTVDGRPQENIVFTYHATNYMSGNSHVNCWSLMYFGDDHDMPRIHIKLADALRKLKEWQFSAEHDWINSAATSQTVTYCWPLN